MAFLATLGLGGCAANTTDEVIEARPPDPALSGRFFATAGESANTDLYEVSFDPVRLYRLTEVGRFGGIGACADSLVVATAHKEVGFQDTLQQFRDGRLQPVEGLGTPKAGLPELAPDCRLVFTDVDRSGPELVERLLRWEPQTRTTAVLHSAILLGVPEWGPGGRIAVFEGRVGSDDKPPVATGIVVISPDGSRRTIESPVPEFGVLQWDGSPWMAIGQERKGTVFLNPDTAERAELPGWVPLAWSPDAQRLLVADAKERTELGLVEATNLGAVRRLGKAGTAIYDVVWLAHDALDEIPLPAGQPEF
jgi:hypothetical protein